MKMSRISALLERADDGLRAFLMRACRRTWLLEGLTLLGFFVLMMTRTLKLTAGAAAAYRIATVLMLCVPLAVMLRFAMRAVKDQSGSVLAALASCALCAVSMLLRVSFIERSSGDYDIYLANWIARLAEGSFGEGMKANIGEYNVLYQYILFIITRLPVAPLYAVKAVSFVGDAFLAGAAARLAGRNGKGCMTAFALVLLLPSIALNGGMFAQCDSLYAACALWGLTLALERKPMRAAACFALSLAFKLQAAFILPIVVILWGHRRFQLRDAIVFVGSLFAVMLPALLGGKSLMDIIGIYTAQTGLYTGLNYNAANFFGMMNTTGLDVYAYGNFGMALAFGVCAALVYIGLAGGEKTEDLQYLRLALLMVLLIVFFLPRMHERYFYMALPLAAAYAAQRGGRTAFVPALIELAMLSTLWDLGIPLPLASAMMLLSAILVLSDGKKDCIPEKV